MQGRFKRDGSASAEPEPHGGTGPMKGGPAPQHAQNPGSAGDGGERSGRSGTSAPSGAASPSPALKPPTGPTGPGPRIALRNWRISTRLVSLLALPVVAATSLGALRINQSMDDIQQLDNMKLLTDMTKQATELSAALQEERDQSAGPLAHGGKATDFTVKGLREKTDRAMKNFLDSSEEIDSASKEGNLKGVREYLIQLAGELGDLAQIRKSAYASEGNSTQTIEAYHRLIENLVDLSQDMAEATSNPDMIQRTRALAAFSSAKEYSSIQRAALAAALPASNTTTGKLSPNDRLYAESSLESQKSEIRSFKSIYGEDAAAELLKPIEDGGNSTIKATDTYAGRALVSASGLAQQDKRSYRDWLDDSSTKIQQMKNIEHTLLEEMEQKARELRSATERDAIISGALILIVLGVSLVGAFVVARSMIRSLRRLEETATKVASDRLPELVKQLSESDPQDVDTSVESVGVHSRDEIGRVAAAFDDVHREAVRLAAEQALLRGNVNAMFTNLSRRSQGLIQRQLSLISELESREADPDQLSSLFKLDHLATRMRRNGENLLVLAGEEPGRRWTRPVPLVDVLRAAASEVEQYERIELASVPTTEVAGRVVNDLVHLLAELLENATSFSSPQTKVKVTGHALPDGRVLIEIHDTGIGLSPEDLAAINERLASPPTVDVSVSRRMGLFVVGRLSQRHGIRIQLRPSDSGGTTALVMLPVDVAQGGRKPQPKQPGQPPLGGGGPAAAQAAAGVAAARRGAGPGQGGGALGAGPSGGGALGAGASGAGRLGPGQSPRAALPGRDADGGRQGAPGGARGPQGPDKSPSLFDQGPPSAPPQGRPAPAGAGFGQAPGAPQGLQAAGTNGPQGQEAFGGGRGQQRPGGNAEQGQGRRPQLPPRGGPRAELPGGEPQPRVPSWSDENAQPPVPRASLDAPRGHEEPDVSRTSQMPRIDDRQGPGATAEIPAVPRDDDRQGPGSPADFGMGGPQHPDQFASGTNGSHDPGQFVRPDVFGATAGRRDPSSTTGQFPAPQAPQSYDNGSTGQYPAPRQDNSGSQYPAPRQDNGSTGQYPAPRQDNGSTGQYPAPRQDSGSGRPTLPGPATPADPGGTGQFERPQVNGGRGGSDFGAPRPPAPQARPARQEPEALPPASGPGDGRTPLYDTLETNWFHGQHGQQEQQEQQPQNNGSAPASQQPQGPTGPQRSSAPAGWRSSPNDDLGRQAERVRQPAAGGVTTSGLPRRVPRANLVAGTAQQQPQQQSGPQISRAPDDVRGRLTNLRRGIAQGRQAGSTQTGSFPRPSHQQER
ncbi:sensor histidine kinase [Streptomyces violaceus]|uniref:histidine kinase n=1 Tax=Streptomyces violaceus TaxID=1936 RepID=A0ABY9U605_STRVL|nr:nitrate- and nitrite sensing domain-containing protein [Streptomyces janthinus]WND17975.1 nitrate- and nitrite sensing domain-containing protein [Streptomyces janthinus]GGS83277.1 histidine kinase [Streptomyces janthinus]